MNFSEDEDPELERFAEKVIEKEMKKINGEPDLDEELDEEDLE